MCSVDSFYWHYFLLKIVIMKAVDSEGYGLSRRKKEREKERAATDVSKPQIKPVSVKSNCMAKHH